MKKLFTLAVAVLASLTMWADPTLPADATPTTTLDAAVKDANLYAITNAVHNNKQYYVYDLDTIRVKMKAGNVTWIKGPKNDGGNSANTISFASDDAEVNYGFNSTRNRAWGIHNGRYAGIRVTNCVEFAALTKSNDSKNNKTLYIHVFKKNGESWDFVESLGTDTYNTSKYYVLSATLNASDEYVILLTSGNGSNCLTAQVRFASPYCADPEASIIENTAGFVGDPIDLEWSSNNTNSVTWDIKKGEAATEDASITDGKFTATKTGTYVVTATQTADATYCAVEESVTLTISAKAPVTSFEIEGPTSARVGDEITLTATNFNAAATSIWWTDKYGTTLSSTAEYTFTPVAEGDVVLTAWAENEFNVSSPATLEHTVSVTIGHNAYLSDLKVNGTTIEGFDDEKFEYDLGEIGVYEPVNVTATPADAPYATATVNPGDNNVLITVFAQDETTYKSYTITYTRAAATPLASISGNTTWDWADAGSETEQWSGSTLPTNETEFNFADVLINPAESFNAAALMGIAQYAKRGGSYNCFQGTQVKFNTTVAGIVEIFYQNTSNRNDEGRRWVVVNGTKVGAGAIDQKDWYSVKTNVAADDVVITFIDKNDAATMLRINKIVFSEQTYKVKWSLVGENPEENLIDLEDRAVTDTLYADLQKDVLTTGTYVVKVFVDDATTPIASTNLEISEVAKYDMEFKYQVSTNVLTATATKNGKTTSLDNTEDNAKAVKMIENGQIVIIKNGVRYNVLGAVLK